MIVHRQPDQITAWHVAFFETGNYRFARFVPGRFKHVLAFGYSHPCRTWVVYDIAWAQTRIYVLPDGPLGMAALNEWLAEAVIVRFFPKTGENYAGFMQDKHLGQFAKLRNLASRPLALYCVPAVAHLVGAGCGAVLTPTGFYRALLRQGAEIIDGRGYALRRAGAA